MDLDDDEDEIVEEMDVYLSKELCQNLYLLQYPTSSTKQEYSADQRLAARVKPQHKKIEMDVLLDVSSPNYDHGKGEQIAINVDGGAGGDGITYDNSVMDFQTLSSRSLPLTGKRFAAATVQDGQVHLTPIAHVMQMQPAFKYMDFAEKRAMQTAKMKAQTESGHSSQDEADDAKAVTIRFKNVETEASRALREKSYAAYEKRLYQEKWVNVKVHHKDEAYSERERNRLYSKEAFSTLDNSGDYPDMIVKSETYLQTLVPQYVVSNTDSKTNPENVLSLSKLKHLPLGEQLKLLMKNAKVMHFSHLCSLLPSNPDINSVVRSLQSYAVLVNGCWVVKSDVLYPPDTVSPISGTPADLMCKVRDYILCLFTEQEFLIRREVAKQVNIPGDEVKSILEQIAKLKLSSGWHLKLQRDTDFIEKFPEIQDRQSMVWASRFKQLSKRFSQENEPAEPQSGKSASNTATKSKSSSKTVKTSPTTKRSRKTSQSKIKKEMSEKELNGLKKFLSPPRQTGEDANVIVDHAVVDISDHSAVDVSQPFALPLSASDLSKSCTELLQDIPPPPTNNVPTAPFVNPASLGIKTTFQTPLVEFSEPKVAPSEEDGIMNIDNALSADLQDFQAEGVNMENVHATVALVADQMRQQAVLQKTVFNSSEPSL